jgi:TonB-linked SusC/RagA family outer membrane protein
MRKMLCLLAVVLFTAFIATAQTRSITGTVTDDKGEVVPYASVVVKGTKTGTAADDKGNYKINAKTGDVLVFSGVNLTPKEVAVGSSSTLNVTLARENGTSEVVVVATALNIVRQPKELGYSTAKVKAAELTQAKVVNLQNGLTGKVSGLNIQTVNNGVFADTRINLRGIRSLTGNNQPMLILDGAPISLGYISSINPNDIADVTILKGASATAIYGPDGVNGAIVITTKKGNKQKPNITVSHTTQLETVSFMPKLQTQFGSGSSIDAFGNGVYDPIENQCYGPAFDGSLVTIGRKAPDGTEYKVDYSAKPDEKRKFWATGITNQTDISFSSADFYISAQNVDIQGVLPKDKNNRTSFRVSSAKEYNNFKANFSVTYTRSDYNVNAGSSFGNGRDFTPYWNLINSPMQIPITQFKDWSKPYGTDYSMGSSYWASPDGYFNDYYSNPYFMIDNFRSKGRNDDLIGNLELNYKATSWLSFTYRLSATVTSGSAKATQGAYNYSAFAKASGKSIAGTGDITAAVSDGSSTSSRVNSEFFVTFNKTFNDFKFDALVGTSFRETNAKSVNVSSSNLGIPGLFNISARKGEPGASESNSKARLNRYFGKVGLGYKGWAFAEATASYDIDSRLSYGYGFNMKDISFFYPGASLSAVLSDAIPAIKSSKTISFLKVRGSISKTGNVNLPVYALENTYSPASGFPFGTLLGYTADDILRQKSYQPEFVISKELGFEIGLNKNKINLEATVYQQDNSNQLITVAYSASTGFPSALLNAASFTNKGVELDLKLTPLVKINKVSIDFKANYTYQTNQVTSLVDGVDELGIGNGNYIIKGQSAYMFKLTDYVKDDQGRVVVDKTTGYPSVDPTLRMFGRTLPTHIFGMTLSVNWKQLSFSAVADYRGGNQIYSGIGPDMDFAGISARSAQNGRQPFIFPNSVYFDGTKYVPNTSIYTQNGGYNFWSQNVNTTANSNYLSDGSFWKLREVAIAYNIPSKVFGRLTKNALKSATFTLTGRNLITWLPKTNEWTDPEFSNTTGNAQGVNTRNNTPPTRIFGANLTLNF